MCFAFSLSTLSIANFSLNSKCNITDCYTLTRTIDAVLDKKHDSEDLLTQQVGNPRSHSMSELPGPL